MPIAKIPSRLGTPSRQNLVSDQVTDASRYFFDLNPKHGRPLAVACGGCERVRPDYFINRPGYPFLTIEFVVEGAGFLEMGGATYRLASGVAYAYGPGISHVIRNDPAHPMLKYFVSITGRRPPGFFDCESFHPGVAVQLFASQEVASIFDLLQREGAGGRALAPQICAALAQALVMKICENAMPYSHADPRALETFQRAKRVAESRFLEIASVDALARACHLDASYLCRLFQRFARTAPSRFLTRLKMNRAAEMLMDHPVYIKQVAAALNFADAFHFSRTFKRIYGLSPAQFVRQRHL